MVENGDSKMKKRVVHFFPARNFCVVLVALSTYGLGCGLDPQFVVTTIQRKWRSHAIRPLSREL